MHSATNSSRSKPVRASAGDMGNQQEISASSPVPPPPPGGGYGAPPSPPGGHSSPPGGGGPLTPPSGGPPGNNAPADYKTAGVLMLVSGILNVMVSGTLVLILIWICIGVVWILPLAAGVFEIVTGIKVMGGKPVAEAKTASIVGLVAAILNGNVIGLVLEIIALVNLNKPEIEPYYR